MISSLLVEYQIHDNVWWSSPTAKCGLKTVDCKSWLRMLELSSMTGSVDIPAISHVLFFCSFSSLTSAFLLNHWMSLGWRTCSFCSHSPFPHKWTSPDHATKYCEQAGLIFKFVCSSNSWKHVRNVCNDMLAKQYWLACVHFVSWQWRFINASHACANQRQSSSSTKPGMQTDAHLSEGSEEGRWRWMFLGVDITRSSESRLASPEGITSNQACIELK